MDVALSISSAKVTPVTVLTGFLGTGKTTLLKRILTGAHGLRFAVLVNDFGAINIDADLVVGVESGGDVISLANGCVCCSIRDDLLSAVQQAITRPERPEHIILEASGVAEPSGIAATFLNASLSGQIRLDSIVCVIDASQVFAAPEMMELKLRQIAFSDLLILNKTDLVKKEEVSRIRLWLDDRLNRYLIVEATHADVPLEVLLSVERSEIAAHYGGERHNQACDNSSCSHVHYHDHGDDFSTWNYVTEWPLSLDAVQRVMRKLPKDIYRAKGIINSINDPLHRTVLQVVGRRVEMYRDCQWAGHPRQSRIVVIGAVGSIDPDDMRSRLDSCRTPQPHPIFSGSNSKSTISQDFTS